MAVCVVILQLEFNNMVNRLTYAVNINVDAMRVEKITWSDQFRNALNVNGGDVENASQHRLRNARVDLRLEGEFQFPLCIS
jgi:hypothetical protein